MPIYEYICQECGKKFEVLVGLNSASKITCPGCRSERVKRLISSFGIGGGSNRVKGGSGSCSGCSSHSCSTCK